MSGVAFFQTRMGVRFYESTMPAIADQLERLNKNLAAMLVELRQPVQPVSAGATIGWKATLTQIAQQHLGVDALDDAGPRSLDLREAGLGQLSNALSAAYRAGIAAGIRHVHGDAPQSSPAAADSAPAGADKRAT